MTTIPSDNGWLPIDSAPQDATTPILVTDGHVVALVWWTDQPIFAPKGRWSLDLGGQDECLYYTVRMKPLTHWQPAPKPPECS